VTVQPDDEQPGADEPNVVDWSAPRVVVVATQLACSGVLTAQQKSQHMGNRTGISKDDQVLLSLK
jgi:hypothetical protein